MGYFTFTLANRKEKYTRFGYASDCKLAYGGYGAIICPDDTRIETDNYRGYGIFGSKDVYDLVTEWNREHLEKIFERLETKGDSDYWGKELKEIAVAYQNHDDEELARQIENLSDDETRFKNEWKRNIGITISGDGDNNWDLPFPIKIVNCKRKVKYHSLHPSHVTQ